MGNVRPNNTNLKDSPWKNALGWADCWIQKTVWHKFNDLQTSVLHTSCGPVLVNACCSHTFHFFGTKIQNKHSSRQFSQGYINMVGYQKDIWLLLFKTQICGLLQKVQGYPVWAENSCTYAGRNKQYYKVYY